MLQSPHKRDINYFSDDGHPWEEDSKTGEDIYQPTPKKEPDLKHLGELLYGQTLKWYYSVIVWPMFILLIIEISTMVMQTKYLVSLPPEIFSWVINIARVALFVYLAVIAVKQFSAEKKQVYIASVMGGIVVGIFLAIFQLFWYFELWTFFNLIGQPLLFAAEGLIISWIIIRLFFPSLYKK